MGKFSKNISKMKLILLTVFLWNLSRQVPMEQRMLKKIYSFH